MDEEEVKVDEEVKKVILSVTSDSVRAQGAARRNSTGEANAKTLPSLLSSDERVLPHYLRASTNSCHEFCKYGKKLVFEPKKWKSNLRRESGSIEIPAEEQKAEFSAPRGRRKKPELKAKTEPKGGLIEKPKVIKMNGLKEIYPGTLVVEETEPFEAPESMKLQTPPSQGHIASHEHSPFDKDEESSEEPACIETVTPSPIHQIEELSVASNLESSSPTEKRAVSHEPITHLAWSEKSSDGSESMELELPSPVLSPKSQVEGSSEEPMGVEILTPAPGTEIMAHADESIRSNSAAPSSTEKSSKPKILPLTRRSTSAMARLSIREGKSCEIGFGMKLKTPSPIPRSFAGNEGESLMKNLKNIEGKKRVVNNVKASPQLEIEVSQNAKVVREKRVGVTAKPTVVKKTIPSPVEKMTVTPVKPKVSERKSPSSVKKVIIPVSPRVATQKTTPTIRRMDTLSEPSMSLKPKAPAVKSVRRLSAQRNMGSKMIRSIDLSKLGEDTIPKPSRVSISTKPPVGRENADAKLMKNRNLKPSSSVSSHEKEENENSLREASELVLDKEKTNRSKPVQSAKREVKRILIRTAPATVRTEARIPSPHNLNFRRGKIVSPMPENNTPRKLRFRKGKGTSENSREAVRRIFRRRRVSCGSASELISPSLKAPAVVLRHQDVQEKKDVQGLFNDVIKETASKLVEAKNSKVKALVGAFETVISLQESRVSPTV